MLATKLVKAVVWEVEQQCCSASTAIFGLCGDCMQTCRLGIAFTTQGARLSAQYIGIDVALQHALKLFYGHCKQVLCTGLGWTNKTLLSFFIVSQVEHLGSS